MKIKLIKFENFKGPVRAHHNDSGADVFATETITLEPHSVYKMPLGIGTELPDGYDIVVHCKSGLSSKGIFTSNSPVDAGYRGEIHAIMLNTTNNSYTIKEGEKVGQLVVRPVIYADFIEELGEERGNGGFGSTGK